METGLDKCIGNCLYVCILGVVHHPLLKAIEIFVITMRQCLSSSTGPSRKGGHPSVAKIFAGWLADSDCGLDRHYSVFTVAWYTIQLFP